jgi:hypothetical protein
MGRDRQVGPISVQVCWGLYKQSQDNFPAPRLDHAGKAIILEYNTNNDKYATEQ